MPSQLEAVDKGSKRIIEAISPWRKVAALIAMIIGAALIVVVSYAMWKMDLWKLDRKLKIAITTAASVLGTALIAVGIGSLKKGKLEEISLNCKVSYFPDVMPADLLLDLKTDLLDAPTLALSRLKHKQGKQVKGATLCDYSYIQIRHSAAVVVILEKIESNDLTMRERIALGVLFGAAVGDAFGAHFEHEQFEDQFNTDFKKCKMDMAPSGFTHITKKFTRLKMGLEAGQWTDDTSLTLALADILIEYEGEIPGSQLFLAIKDWWHEGHCNPFRDNPKRSVGAGSRTKAALNTTTPPGPDSIKDYQNDIAVPPRNDPQGAPRDIDNSSNGSLMRLGPVVLVARSAQEAQMLARKQSYVTHTGMMAAESAALLAWSTYNICECKEKNSQKRKAIFLERIAKYDPNLSEIAKGESLERGAELLKIGKMVEELAQSQSVSEGQDPVKHGENNWNWRDEKFTFNGARRAERPGIVGIYAPDALAMALHCVATTDSFTEAMHKAATRGGDADTIAAITGQIAGAIYGYDAIPKNWIAAVQQWAGKGEIAARALKLDQTRQKRCKED